MTASDVIWIGIPVAIAFVFVLTALVTQARGSREVDVGLDTSVDETPERHEHAS